MTNNSFATQLIRVVLSHAIILIFSVSARSQVNIWTDNFNNGCASNCLATTWNGWTMVDNAEGTTGGAPNDWFVSCAEEGITPPGCGSSCIGDASLHISSNPGAGGDMGASFNETGATNATYRLMRSPLISTVNRQTITLKFDFIAYGSSACSDDRAQLWLSTDGGATWPAGYRYCLTSPCCGSCNGYSQGQWTAYSLNLPAAFENNPNVRIGFHWRNNGNGSGTDPSVAIDDILVQGLFPLPTKLLSFDAVKESAKVKLSWKSTAENRLNRYEVERSTATGFTTIANVAAKGNQQGGNISYSTNDPQLFANPVYYRLKMVDQDGVFAYSKIIRVGAAAANTDEVTLLSVNGSMGSIQLSIWSTKDVETNITLYDAAGKKLTAFGKAKLKAGENVLKYNLSRIAAATYIIKVESPATTRQKEVNLARKFIYTK